MADIMNPETQTLQEQTHPLIDLDERAPIPRLYQNNSFLANYRSNPFPCNPNNPFWKHPAKLDNQLTTQQNSQQQDTREEAKNNREMGGTDELPMEWCFPPGHFRGRYSTMPSEAGSYDWSDLDHLACQPSNPKLPLPTAFTDKEDNVEPYIDRTAYFIELHNNRFRENTDQVYLFLQGCTGTLGHPWAAGIMRLYLNKHHKDVVRPQVATLQQVIMRFRKRFGIIDKKRYAQAKFERLQQGSQSIRNDVAAFEQLELEVGAVVVQKLSKS
ncbi:unnamed protein product [Peniophora sp. CBMAI 1063]|nr:unnamed protein product [Peniophora sp. CBMAI 1063]